MAIQHAAAAALADKSIAERTREKYRRRLQKLVGALTRVGFRARMPGGTYFLYVPAPSGAAGRLFKDAEEASQFMIQEQSVCCVPWDDAGPYLRFSVTYLAKDEPEEDRLMEETVEHLGTMKLRFDDVSRVD